MNALHQPPSVFTNAEFEKLVRAGGIGDFRMELRRGVIVKMSPQYVPHAAVKRLLARVLETAIARADPGWVVDQETSVDFGGTFVPLPDIIVWDPSAAPANLDGPIPASAVKLIVEVADTTLADDLGDKLEDYALAGLAEYWVADVRGRQIVQHADASGAGYARRETRTFGETFPSMAYTALAIDTSSLVSLRF